MNYKSESGNIIFMVLIAIVLIGIVTAAMRGGDEGENIDKENMTIKTTQLLQYASELERGIGYIMANGASESDLRFAHADAHSDYGDINDNPAAQLFHRNGGGAAYRAPLPDLNDGSAWEFYGHTHFPLVGTTSADLIAVLPNVVAELCAKVNKMGGFDPAIAPKDDADDCINGGTGARFDNGTQYSVSPNTVDEATFTVQPSLRGCVQCDDGSLHFYQVLLSR